MSLKMSPLPRKPRQNDEINPEMLAPVHRSAKGERCLDRESKKNLENSDDGSDSNRTYILEDKNENFTIRTPSREISVDGEAQINSKILALIESEMKRDVKKSSHFSDSRPQSLSFYEEEKMPEELSGNLELLSPEEKKHYKRRKDHAQLDAEDSNIYDPIRDIYNGDHEDNLANGFSKKSKSRKKRHQDQEVGLGDSREMMIPKEKRKSKKKRWDSSPMSSKRKHKKRDEEYEQRTDIALALEELQDDVFENTAEDYGSRSDKLRKSPKKSDKTFVQKKNKFEQVNNRENEYLNGSGSDHTKKKFWDLHPVQFATAYHKKWMSFSTFSHGLLGGVAFAHYAFMDRSYWPTHGEYLQYIANYNRFYNTFFYFLSVICLISVFDKYDVARLDKTQLVNLLKNNKRSIVILLYMACVIVDLVTAPVDDKINLTVYNSTDVNVTEEDITYWNNLSFWRTALAFSAWVIVSICPFDDMLDVHLRSMEKYIIPR